MKKFYFKTLVLALGILSWSATANAQNLLSEDFSTATGTTPPAGWVNNEIAPNGGLWVFDNPGGKTINSPMSAPFAGFDSDYLGNDNYAENTALESVAFDASSVTGSVFLSFDQAFNGGAGGKIYVEVFDGTTWVPVLSNVSGGVTTNPDHQSIDITTALNGASNAQVRFRWVGDWSFYWFIDNISVDVDPVNCDPVSGITLAGVTAITADITWTAGGTENDWNIETGAPGFSPGTGTEVDAGSASTESYTINGLTSGNSYDVYVQADCGGAVSTWFGPFAITTTCTAANVPYVQDFESATTPDMPVCTSTENVGTGNEWITDNVNSSGFNSIVLNYNFSNSNPADTWFYTQGINLTAGTNYQISYDYGDWGDNEKLKVAYGTDPISSSMTNILDDHTTLGNSTLVSNVVIFTPSATGVYYFGFNAHSDASLGKLFVDNILVDLAPACPDVSGIALASTTQITADISWTAGGTESAWNIEWGTPGFAPGTGAELDAGSSAATTYQITGLTNSTTYEVYVQADCGGGLANWYGPFTFTTDCGVADVPYFQDFESAVLPAMPACNSSENVGAGNEWKTTNIPSSPFNSISLTYIYSPSNPGNTWYYTQGINLTAGTYYEISYDYANIGNYEESFKVAYGSAANSTSMTNSLADHQEVQTLGNIGSNMVTFTPPTTGVYYFGFNGYSDANLNYLFVDNILVDIAVACPTVSGLTVTNETINQIDISWTTGSTEGAWNIEWGTAGYTPGTGTEIGADNSGVTTYSITGLNISTDYDIYVQANCAGDGTSTWVLVQGATLCGPITTLPWTENFDGLLIVGDGKFPNCWRDDNGSWYTDDENAAHGDSYSAPNHVSVDYGSDDYLWTPEFNLTAGTTYEFSFRWLGDNKAGWYGGVFTSPVQSNADATQIGSEFVDSLEVTSSTDYKKEIYCFTPTTSGVYSFGIYVLANYYPYTLSFDNFSLNVSVPLNAGLDGSATVCQTAGLVDLNSVITIDDPTGVWKYDQNPSAIQNDNFFDPSAVSSGITNVYYVIEGCAADTAIATLDIAPQLSAGIDSVLSFCNGGLYDLFDGLDGSGDYGGQWYDSINQPVTGSVVNLIGASIGNYSYTYVVDNVVCPADTSNVVIQLKDCVGLDEYDLKGFVLYPNPSNGLVNIQYSGKGEDVKLEVVDAIGKVILTKQVQFNDGTTQKVDLSDVEKGIYYINMTAKEGRSVMKVVKK